MGVANATTGKLGSGSCSRPSALGYYKPHNEHALLFSQATNTDISWGPWIVTSATTRSGDRQLHPSASAVRGSQRRRW